MFTNYHINSLHDAFFLIIFRGFFLKNFFFKNLVIFQNTIRLFNKFGTRLVQKFDKVCLGKVRVKTQNMQQISNMMTDRRTCDISTNLGLFDLIL